MSAKLALLRPPGSRSGSSLALALVLPMFLASAAWSQVPGTVVTFPWDWHISASPNTGGPTGQPIPGVPIPIWLWGNATTVFGAPELVGGDPNAPPTFDLGPGGVGSDIMTAQAPPLGGVYQIPLELVELELHSMGPPVVFPGGTSEVIIRNDPNRPTTGMIQNLRNNGDGTASMDSFFDIFVEIELPQLGMTLHMEQPLRAGMTFGDTGSPIPAFPPTGPLPELDILWAPTWIWREFPPGTGPQWLDASLHPWDWWVTIHGHVTVPEPSSVALVGLSMIVAGAVLAKRRRTG